VHDTLAPPPLAGEAPEAPGDGQSPARRLVVSAADSVRSFRLAAGSTLTIGRQLDNDVVIAHDAVSRLHARITVSDRVEIQDAGSRNGTRVNGTLVPPGTPNKLGAGVVVHIGPATLFLVEGADTESATVSRRESAAMMAAAKPSGALERPTGTGSTALVLRDDRMTLLYENARILASSGISVLILGETGVGKELLAHRIHAMSARRSRPFVTFNSAALPETLVESELFGYARGAFTGAHRSKAGLFETADTGTIFLDEVADLSLAAQAKLLRVIESGEVLCVGALKPKAVDVRVVSATNRDLDALMTAGQFRRDLYYRLSGATLNVPPLRERPADIPALVEHFAARCAESAGIPRPAFGEDAMAALIAYPWPGNARELKNVVERVALLTKGRRVRAEDLSLSIPSSSSTAQFPPLLMGEITNPSGTRILEATVPHGQSPTITDSSSDLGARAAQLRHELASHERGRIVEALAQANGNQVVAARLLGVSRRTLVNRLNAYDIPRPRKGQR
jgi:transcriptional regulator with GAF, ATPase, and Fis domain